ncbi:hypothetical protein GCM10010193_14640 [Kitasatospora atroaurantiaca]|uniref:EcsC family protein n=1 Tax=Kitasatospora atroaurantiaca TaxID=285545 RepID=A0A561EIF3_9ACTN|nr:hypothetical protein [Kitasatospora atroaurantiaca]TWE15352.1 hypothetical protein FB465_0245 [Kitasatospora atroaurantiaca]
MRLPHRPRPSGDDPLSNSSAVPGEAAEELAALSTEMERSLPDAAPAARQAWYREHGRRRATALLSTLTRMLGRGGLVVAKGAGYGGRALAERLVQSAPRIPVRKLATLRAQYPDATGPEELADRLITGACRASGALGAGVGAAAMMPVPPALPVEIAAETLAVAAVEIKLIAELHEVYGVPAAGNVTQRATAYVTAWANRRGIDGSLLVRPAGLAAMAVGSEVRRKVSKRLTRSSLRKLPSMLPFLVGAGIGATLNRRETRKLAVQVRTDLQHRTPADAGYWTAVAPGGDVSE